MIKILLAENKIDDLDFMKTVIDWENNGFEVVDSALNGKELIEKVKLYCPDLVITEYNLIGIQGIELIKQIQVVQKHTKFIFTSNYKSFENVQCAINLGAYDYIIKKEMDINYVLNRLETIKFKILNHRT